MVLLSEHPIQISCVSTNSHTVACLVLAARERRIMTHNQIAYFQLEETRRANRANESETARHNTSTESETRRHNQVGEGETVRHNLEQEKISLSSLEETKRANRANEALKSGELDIRQSTLRETERHNKADEHLTAVKNATSGAKDIASAAASTLPVATAAGATVASGVAAASARAGKARKLATKLSKFIPDPPIVIPNFKQIYHPITRSASRSVSET